MIRQPLSDDVIYAWHRKALAGERPQITHEPEAGWFKRRLIRGGPWVPCRIWLEQPIDKETGQLCGDTYLRCEVGEAERDPEEEWTYLAGRPITKAEYDYLKADAEYLKRYHPHAPELHPQHKVKTSSIPRLF